MTRFGLVIAALSAALLSAALDAPSAQAQPAGATSPALYQGADREQMLIAGAKR